MEDATYFRRVINAYRSYGRHSLAVLENKKRQLDRLSTHHQQLLDVAGYTAKIERARHCILKNQNFINRIVGSAAEMENSTSGTSSNMVTDDQMEKIRSTLRQFVREWSMEGQKEREQTFGVVCRRIQALFPSLTKASDIQILVPGAGLGRLAHDIAKLGYNCQGNEFSFEMLLASNMILNRCERQNQFTIHPWLHQFSNQWTADNQLKAIHIPDHCPGGIKSEFSMVAGEFLEAYGDQRDCWDCVATCFFIDTAHNPVDYMECIFRLLCPGGYWINLGPLLYHYESQPGQASIELTAAELMSIAEAIGFQIIVDSELNGRCVDGPALDGCFIKSSTYCGNGASMLSYNYRSVLFTARKPVMRVNK